MLFRRKKDTDAAVAPQVAQPAGSADTSLAQPAGNSLFGRKTSVMTALPVNFGLDSPGPAAMPSSVQTVAPPALSMAPGFQEPLASGHRPSPEFDGNGPDTVARSLQYQQAEQAPDGQSALPMPTVPVSTFNGEAGGFAAPSPLGHSAFEPAAESTLPFGTAQPISQEAIADIAELSSPFSPIASQSASQGAYQGAPQGLPSPALENQPPAMGSWASVGQPLPLHGTLSDDDLSLTPGPLDGINNVMSHGADAAAGFTPSSPAWETPAPAWMTPEASTSAVAPVGRAFQPMGLPVAHAPQSPFQPVLQPGQSYQQDDFYALDAPSFEAGSPGLQPTGPAASPFQGWADGPAAMAPIVEHPAFESGTSDPADSLQPAFSLQELSAFESGDYAASSSTDTLWIDEDGEAILTLDESGYASNTSLIEPDLPAPLNAQEQALLAELERQQASHPDDVDEFNADFVLQEAHQLLEEPLDYLSWQTQHPQVIQTPEAVADDETQAFTSLIAHEGLPSQSFAALQEPVDLRNLSPQPVLPSIEYYDEDEDGGTFNLSEPDPAPTDTSALPVTEIALLAGFQSVTPVAQEEPVSPWVEPGKPTFSFPAKSPELAADYGTPQPVEPVDSVIAHSEFGSGSWQEAQPAGFQPLSQSPGLESESVTDALDEPTLPLPVAISPLVEEPEFRVSAPVESPPEEFLQPTAFAHAPSNVTPLNPPLGVITIHDFALDAIRVVLSHELSAQHRLYVAQVNGRCVLIGQTSGRIELLQFIELPELSPQTAFVVAEAATSVSRRLLFVQVGTWQGHILVDNSGMLVQKSPVV